jgi:hypothetical protein
MDVNDALLIVAVTGACFIAGLVVGALVMAYVMERSSRW